MRGKTVISKTNQVQSTYINIPRDLMERYQLINLSSNFAFFNIITLLIKTSHHIKFTTALTNKYQLTKPAIENIKEVKAQYSKRSFRIEKMWIDRKFEPYHDKSSLLNIGLNTIFKGKHVPEIERLNHIIKERVRTIYNDLNRKLTKLSEVLIREMIYT